MQNIQSLAFDEIKANLIDTIKKQGGKFRNFDFEASGLNTIINLLAYNSHMIGYYVRMMLNESFIDTAKLKQSMLSHAKLMGYVYKGRRSSRAELFVKQDVPADQVPESRRILIEKGTVFESTTNTQTKRSFVVIDDFYLTNAISINSGTTVRFVNDTDPATPLVVYEGTIDKWKFLVSGDQLQRYVIKREGVDYETIRVKVYDSQAAYDSSPDNYTSFYFSKSAIEINTNSPVFYITTDETGFYEILFGADVYGKGVQAGNVIEVDYMISNGTQGNNAGSTGEWNDAVAPGDVANARPTSVDISWWSNDDRMARYPQYQDAADGTPYRPVSSGGMDEETVDELRFNIPNSFVRQNRIVTEQDYKTIILNDFRNVDSINVWGGEKNYRKEYGKVFVCIKPKFTSKLSISAKAEIADRILKSYGVVGSDVVFVDPDFIDMDVEITAKYDKSKTDMGRGRMETEILAHYREYEALNLGKFETNYSEVAALDYIRAQMPAIKSLFTHKTLHKSVTVRYTMQPQTEILFGNALNKRMVSSTFIYGTSEVYFASSDDGVVNMYYLNGNNMVSSVSYGNVDYDAGVVTLTFPDLISMTGDADKGTTGILTIGVTPRNPDVETYLNSIIRIASVKVTANG